MYTKLDIKNSIYKNLDISSDYIFFNEYRGKKPVLFDNVLDLLLDWKTGPEIAKHFNRGEQTFNRNIRKMFPDVKLSGRQSWALFFIENSSFKQCKECLDIFTIDFFNNNGHDRLEHKCKYCRSVYWQDYYNKNKSSVVFSVSIRKARLLRAIPKWANLEKIKELYKNCPEGYHVDHIIPLQGKNVCGLHVENNLQYLTAKDNLVKSNKFDGE
jgi:hypothetical protein